MALKTFTVGEVLTASDVNVYLKNTIYAQKSGTESVTSSTALQDDNDLTVSVAASSVYEMTVMLAYDAAAAGDLKIQWVAPAGATLTWTMHALPTTAAGQADIQTFSAGDLSTVHSIGALGAGATYAAHVTGLLTVGVTAGTFKLQWAQATSNATATRLFADSYLCLRRVS